MNRIIEMLLTASFLAVGISRAAEITYVDAVSGPSGNTVATRLLGIDVNCNDSLAAPVQSLFRSVSCSASAALNTNSYRKIINRYKVTITSPSDEAFEFRGANGDISREIPGGDMSRSYLVADFLGTRNGAIDITFHDLPAGTYLFCSSHLEPFNEDTLGYAQGINPGIITECPFKESYE